MGYLKIPNLYSDQTILKFRECYALEKIHGTSANLSYRDGKFSLFSGGIKHSNFEELFNQSYMKDKLSQIAGNITIFGEAYGGKCQKMSETYGASLKFIAFDVKINNNW